MRRGLFKPVPQQTFDRVLIALVWATWGGAIVGGIALTFQLIINHRAGGFVENFCTLPLVALTIGVLSLVAVIPCTLVFGLISQSLIAHSRLSWLTALIVCIATASATQIGFVASFWWDGSFKPGDFYATTPFALGAAATFWWKLNRQPADRLQ
ncbi:hypothetical protein MTsPCn3_07910 [Erythrobacter sp. MTPC3]